VADPTEAGFTRKSEYTFLRNVSPMIHSGPLLGPVDTKMAPNTLVARDFSWANLKSSGEMDHVWLPKEITTWTVVKQAMGKKENK
jgi:hypothetical protein